MEIITGRIYVGDKLCKMKAELYFGIWMKFLRTEYEPLKKLALNPTYDYAMQSYRWIFKYSDIEKVEAIIGTIEIPGLREGFKKEEVVVPKFKGKDFVEIVEYPKIYQIVEHRKVEDPETGEIEVKALKHNLDKVLVNRIWKNVISRQPLNKPVKTSTVAENICRELEITRFNRSSGTFQFDKFFGSRKDYYKYLYLPLKVLQWQGKIIHHKYGAVENIK